MDVCDQKVRHFTTRRATRRWPVTQFCNVLDMALCNSLILFKLRNEGTSITRFKYLVEVAEDLIAPEMERRSQIGLHANTLRALAMCGIGTDKNNMGKLELTFIRIH